MNRLVCVLVGHRWTPYKTAVAAPGRRLRVTQAEWCTRCKAHR